MGPYCKFCDFRCFVIRVLPDGTTRMMGTCLRGMEFDRRACGLDHIAAINPVTDPEAVDALRAKLSAASATTEARDMTELLPPSAPRVERTEFPGDGADAAAVVVERHVSPHGREVVIGPALFGPESGPEKLRALAAALEFNAVWLESGDSR